MSKSNELDKVSKLYILDCIDSEGYEDCTYFNQCETAQDKINFIQARFKSEYQWRVDQVGEQIALTDWLQGLAINIDYMNYNILNLAVKWGSIPENATEKQEQKILDNWFNFIAAKIGQLFRGYRVPKRLK